MRSVREALTWPVEEGTAKTTSYVAWSRAYGPTIQDSPVERTISFALRDALSEEIER